MKEMATMRNQVIDQMVDDILAKRELLDYFVSTVMESIPQNSRKDKKLCETIVSFTMDEALKDSRVLQLIQHVVTKPSSPKKKNKKSKRKPKPRSPIYLADESTEESFQPSFSLTEPIQLEQASTKRNMKKIKTSELIEKRNRELQQHSNASNANVSDLSETGTLTFTGKEINFKKTRDKHQQLQTTQPSALDISEEVEEDNYDRIQSDLNSSCSTVNNNLPTENNVDIYASSSSSSSSEGDDNGEEGGAGGEGEDDVEAYMAAWERRVQNNLVEDNLEPDADEEQQERRWRGSQDIDKDEDYHTRSSSGGYYSALSVDCDEYEPEQQQQDKETEDKEPIAPSHSESPSSTGRVKEQKQQGQSSDDQQLPYSLSCTLLSGTNTSTSNMLFFDQSTFDNEVDHLQSGKKEPFQGRRKVRFARQLVSGIHYRDKVTPDEKLDMFYNPMEEYRFTRDQSREFAKAEAEGLTWNQWIERRTDEEAERDELEAAAAAEEEGGLLMYYEDDDEDDDNDEIVDQVEGSSSSGGAVKKLFKISGGTGGAMMSFADFMDGANEYGYDADTGFTDLLDAAEGEGEEDESESEGEEDFEVEHIEGSNDESDWSGAVVFDRTASAHHLDSATSAASATGGARDRLEVVFERDGYDDDDATPNICSPPGSNVRCLSGSTEETEQQWDQMPTAPDCEEDDDSCGSAEGGEGSSMDTLEDGQPYQRTTVSKIQKLTAQRQGFNLRDYTVDEPEGYDDEKVVVMDEEEEEEQLLSEAEETASEGDELEEQPGDLEDSGF